jgi:acetyltransferase-like isoleucine patch superfamily enzyme
MTSVAYLEPHHWTSRDLPANVRLGTNSVITGVHAFERFLSRVEPALVIGAHCTMDGVHFNLGEEARIEIGDHCHFKDAVLLSELELRIGNHVVVGWNATLLDADFHPTPPDARIADAMAISPLLGSGRPRPPFVRRPVIIEDDVWIGPNATILKGVRIGAGAFVEPGAVVVSDVPPRSRVLGNPARVIGDV